MVTLMSASGRLGFQRSRVGSGPLLVWRAALETGQRLTIGHLAAAESAA